MPTDQSDPTMRGEELLPCPFCGSTNVKADGWTSSETSGPVCADCGAVAGSIEQTPQENVAAWNRRTTPTPSVAAGALREAFQPEDFARWHKLVRDWSGSAFLAGEEVAASEQRRLLTALYSDLCKLGNWLDAWGDDARKLHTALAQERPAGGVEGIRRRCENYLLSLGTTEGGYAQGQIDAYRAVIFDCDRALAGSNPTPPASLDAEAVRTLCANAIECMMIPEHNVKVVHALGRALKVIRALALPSATEGRQEGEAS